MINNRYKRIQVSHSLSPVLGTLQLSTSLVVKLHSKEVQHHAVSSQHPVLSHPAGPNKLQKIHQTADKKNLHEHVQVL